MDFGVVRDGVRRIFRLRVHQERLARADAEEELRGYVDARMAQLMAAGLSPADAHAEAIRRLGGDYERALTDAVRSAELRERTMRLRDYLDELGDDLRYAIRGLRREKLFTAFIIVALALGIGANAAMYGVIDRLLLRGPEHVVNPDRVMRAYWTSNMPPRGDVTTEYFGWVSYDIFRGLSSVVEGAGAYTVNPRRAVLGEGADARQVTGAEATWDLFPLLGVRPALGRFFSAAEDNADAPQQVAVLGYGLWQGMFGGDSAVVGKSVTLDSRRFTVIGVAPRAFTGPQLAPADLWVPLSLRSRTATTNWTRSFNAQWLHIVARLKPGVSAEQAGAAATTAYRAAYTGTDDGGRRARISFHPLSANNRGRESTEATVSRWLLGVTLVVLLIACANVANLLLARAVRRRREVAVRIALGAGRRRLLRLMLTESALLAFLGALAGLVVAWGTATLMRSVLLPDIDWPTPPVNATVLVVSLVLASAVGLLTGLVPALRASRPEVGAALKAGAREGGGHSSRLRATLTVSQAALSVLLLAGAGLFVRSLARVRSLDMGIEPDRVLVTRLNYATAARIVDPKDAPEVARRTQVFRDAMQLARALPSVEDASLSVGLPFQSAFGLELRVAGRDSIPQLAGGSPNVAAVTDGYFATVGTRLLEGRAFTPADRDGSEPVAIVNETMAATLWPGRPAIGECLYWGEDRRHLVTCSRIVGVVANANSFALREDPHMNYYVPFGQERGMGGTVLLVRPRTGQEAAATAAIKALVMGLDPSITYVQTRLLQDAVDPQVRPWKLGAAMFTLLGVLALIVAAVGLYSVMSYLVAQRTREIGVRIALGAQATSIVGLILRNGISLAGLGVGIGIALAFVGGRFIEPLLFDTSPRDPAVLGGIAALLLAVAALASAVPALRARRVDPMEALRSD